MFYLYICKGRGIDIHVRKEEIEENRLKIRKKDNIYINKNDSPAASNP